MIDGIEVIDFHAHQGGWEFYGMRDDPARLITAMDLAGIDRACLFNIFHVDLRTGHEQLSRMVKAAAGWFIGFAYATPVCPEMVAEVQHAIDHLGFLAIKIYPPAGDIIVTDPRWRPLFRFANDRGLTIISHTGTERSCEPRHFAEIAPEYPEAKFVLGHSGNVEPQRTQAIDAARRCGNIYLETCSTYRQPGVIEQLVNGAGPDRVLYGSDMPLMDPRSQIGKIITARISDDAKRLVLGGNARRLLRLRRHAGEA